MTEKEKKDRLFSVFANRIEELLFTKGITQRDLSNATQIPNANLSAYLRGRKDKRGERSECGIFNLRKIADELNVSTDFLLGKTEVSTSEIEVKAICDYIGLSEKTIKRLHRFYETKSSHIGIIETTINAILDYCFKNLK